MSKITFLNNLTTLDLPAERILQSAIEAGLSRVVVLGYDSDGDEYFASSFSDGGEVMWLLERSKLKLMQTVE